MLFQTMCQALRLKSEANGEVPKTAALQVATWGQLQTKSFTIHPHVKMPNFMAEINIYTVVQKQFWSL